MKLAFNGKARYTDFTSGYEAYKSRNATRNPVDEGVYKRVVKAYCRIAAQRLEEEGQIEIPHNIGTITAALITRRPQYRKDKFVGYGAWDWKNRRYDGKLKAFSIVFLPNMRNNANLRCFGFVANRRLFKAMKSAYEKRSAAWQPVEFNNDMI